MTQTASDALKSQPPVLDTRSQPAHDRSVQTTPTRLTEALLSPEPSKTNGENVQTAEDEGPPAKKRRVSESATAPRKKLVSPPWKKIVAEGPSSFTVDGKRKSGRTNHIPLELQPPSDKRQTRGNQKTYTSKNKNGNANGTQQIRDGPATQANGTRKQSSNGIALAQQQLKSPTQKVTTSPRKSHRKSMPSEQKHTPARLQRASPTPKTPNSAPSRSRTEKVRRSRRGDINGNDVVPHSPVKQDVLVGESPRTMLSRIKFRVKPATLPFTHPGRELKRAKQYPTFRDFVVAARYIPVEDGGLNSVEDGPEITPELVHRDASLLLQLEKAAEPGGVLSEGICSVYAPPEPDYIPPQYAHQDHMNRAAIEFRRLMVIEEKKHRAIAKRLAEACREEWIRKQPKSAEQLEAEKAKAGENRYRFLVKILQTTWANARAEVNRRRLVEWQAQEQARVRKALNEAVDKSTLKLQAQGAFRDSELASEDDLTDNSEGQDRGDGEDGSGLDSDTDERESNMSSESEPEEELPEPDVVADEHLTQQQLREKYAYLQDISKFNDDIEMLHVAETEPSVQGETEARTDFSDSDESIDMDDDLGSSDEGSRTEEDEGDDESEDAGHASLLGFIAPSDLKAMEVDTVNVNGDSNEEAKATGVVSSNEHKEVASLISNGIDSTMPLDGNNAEGPQMVSKLTIENPAPPKQVLELNVASPDRSSQPTSRTTETRPSEMDSASSVELHQTSRQASQSATPQLTNNIKTPIPFLLRGTLREYQHYSLDWMAGLYANHTNGILADEMGLGKTIQTISLLAHLACQHEVWGPHLVIVPTSVILNWEMEFKKWLPGFKVLTYYGNIDERRKKRIGWNADDSWNVCITSYQIILRDQAVFKRRRWHYMILDEAHNIKNFQSQRWQAMLTFNTRARLLLTGTPLQNNLTELWSLLYFLMPSDGTEQGVGGFANLKEFQDWFKKPSEQILEHGRDQMDDESKAIIAKLHKVLRPYLLRRLKADVEKQMPAKYEHVEFCRLSKRQRELYDSFLSREDTRGTLASGNYLSIINCLMQLRKVCNHPDLFLDRPIMTSFPMKKSAIADFEIKELLVRRRLLKEDPMASASLEFLNLVPTRHERLSAAVTTRSAALSAQRHLMDMREAQRNRASIALHQLNPSTANSNLVYLESASRWGRFEELQHCVYLNALRRQQKPIYGKQVLNFFDLGLDRRPFKQKPKKRVDLIDWHVGNSSVLSQMVPTLALRSEMMETTIRKFACVTPTVVARDMPTITLSERGVNAIQSSIDPSVKDPFHEARMRLSIQFPDRRLLQYDCGKLQTLDKLLRRLQSGGHRVLIFTQMTKVLDILEQFLNIHGHKYLRLDGNTKVEQRQILTDRFNNDTRILAFILSSRSGGLGINLTGADTVIFYDLDWNPAMDKQCQDRCHRIGQTRDVHIYRLVSEHTIEANILRKANQKRMLDDVVIQEGEFTTDYLNKRLDQDLAQEKESTPLDEDAAAASAAMDRVLGGPDNSKNVQRVLAQAEDREDVAAARVAEQEINETDAADFDENAVTATATPTAGETPQDLVDTPADAATPAAGEAVDLDVEEDELELNAWGERVQSTDDYMIKFMTDELKDTPVDLPRDKNKRGKDGRNRSHRAR